MATHSSILAWKIPMDRGAWRATVHVVSKSQTEQLRTYAHLKHKREHRLKVKNERSSEAGPRMRLGWYNKGATDTQYGCTPVDVWPVIEKYLDPSSLSSAFGQKLLIFLGFQGCKTLLILKRGCSMHIYCLPGHFRTTFYKKALFHLLLVLGSYMKLFVLLQNSVVFFKFRTYFEK